MPPQPTCATCKFRFLHFRPLPATFLTIAVYLALFIPLVVIHYVPPSVPSPDRIDSSYGINLERVWHSLATVTKKYHPYNSHENDDVRKFLVDSIQDIISKNEAKGRAEVIEDKEVNVLYRGSRNVSIYFESLNIICKVQGDGDFGDAELGDVLVNAHYDSVSTAPGATDDGVAVVTLLGLIDHFTQPSYTPKRSIVFLINNGEEDYLNGAIAYTEHPLAKFTRIFLNLEGAGAGGRATLFRSTDAEVTKFYKRAKHPFGSSLSGDAFKRGFIRSETDYVIFEGELGMRGLDVAFWRPRARYHTRWDSMAFTSRKSLWHMLETSINTVAAMADDSSYTFVEGSGNKHSGVWWDMFGRSLALLTIHSSFIISMCLLTITPFIIIAILFLLARSEKLYLFAKSPKSNGPLPAKLELSGLRGAFRFPIAFVVSTGAVFGVAMLIAKVNPMIVYSSQEAVWICLLSLWLIVSWAIHHTAGVYRPSATARTWALVWMTLLFWILLIVNAVMEDKLDMSGGYFLIFYYAATFLSLVISLVEFFYLPPMSHLYESIPHNTGSTLDDEDDNEHRSLIAASVTSDTHDRHSVDEADEQEATETTSLLRNPSGIGRGRVFGRGPASHVSRYFGVNPPPPVIHNHEEEDDCVRGVECSKRQYPGEQYWSRFLPLWTWLVQVLVLVPIPIILAGQIALLVGTSIAQTGADGSGLSIPYLAYSFFVVMVLLPLSPWIGRWTWHVPAFLAVIFLGTLLYNLLAFPFSIENPLKVYFSQSVDLTSGENWSYVVGVGPYVQDIVRNYLPSAWDKSVDCGDDELRKGLVRCKWHGEMPDVVPGKGYNDWIDFDTSLQIDLTKKTRVITMNLTPRNSRGCRIKFDRKIHDFTVTQLNGNGTTIIHGDPKNGDEGVDQLRLWTRDWERGWKVEVDEGADGGRNLKGKVECFWSDVNEKGVVPGYDELMRYLPAWGAMTKMEDGIVYGVVPFDL